MIYGLDAGLAENLFISKMRIKDSPRALITGGHGFIAGHLFQRLFTGGMEIDILPRSVLMGKGLDAFLSRKHYDYIFHLAAYGNHSFQTEQEVVTEVNVGGTFKLLEATKNIDYKAFLNFSTTYHNLEAGSFYGSTKAASEYLARAFVRNFNRPIINIRPYSVFGEREWDFRFIPTIARQIRAGEDITVSDVSHDWIYVEDFIDGLIMATSNADKLIGRSVGIGTGKRVSNLSIAKKMMEVAGRKVTIIPGIKREYEIAAYGKELINRNESQRNEVEYFSYAKTPLDVSLKRVYDNPNLWLKRETKKES